MPSLRSPNLEVLRLLVEVGSRGSLGRAANTLGISQPAASKRIAQLEREMQLQLVVRTPGGSSLTMEGRIVTEWAQKVLETVEQMHAAVQSLRSDSDQDLRVAASMTIAENLMPTWLFELRGAHPALHVGLEVANSVQVQALVLGGSADIGFVECPTVDNRLDSRRVAMDRLAVVVDPGHKWAKRTRPLLKSQLVSTPLVVREPGSGTRLTLDRALGDAHAKSLLELGSNEAVKGAVMAGAGPAVLSVHAVAQALESGRLVEVTVADLDLSRALTAVWPKGNRLNDTLKWLLWTAEHGERVRASRLRSGAGAVRP